MKHVGRCWNGVLVALVLLALGAATVPERAQAQTPGPRYFPQTGHYLRGAFRSFWERSGNIGIFGYPITEEYIRRSDGKLVQYFERARFELRIVGNQALVDLGLIGREASAGRDFGRIGPFPSTNFQRYFPETGHSLRGSFKNFWERNGGLATFGFPISEEINEQLGGAIYLVQYFERARFELVGNSVRLCLLGRALAPCAATGGLPNNAAPGGPLQEPADTRPCGGGGSTGGALRGQVYPSPARPGSVLGFIAQGFDGNETVSLWINLPGGSVRGLPYQAIAASDGGVLIGFRTLETDPDGFYSLVAYGTKTRRQIVAPFQLRR
jgi:hypothetical protein